MKAMEWYKLDQLLAEHLNQMGMEQLQKNVAHLLFEIGALRRELASKGLVKQDARRRDINRDLVDRVYSKLQLDSSGLKSAIKKSLKRLPHLPPIRRR
jgi:hypothetical protein